MSWLFGKKKIVPKVPFPEGKTFDEKSLRFSKPSSSEKIIRPDLVQAAAGLDRLKAFPEEEVEPEQAFAPEGFPPESAFTKPKMLPARKKEPYFVKVSTYRQILLELNEMRRGINELKEINKDLGRAEYHEDTNFIKLRRATKFMHDRLLHIDKRIFKGE